MSRPIKDKRNNVSGFTILELLVVLAIIGTLSVIGTPMFQSWGTSRSFDSTVGSFYANLTKARMEAFSRGVTIRHLTSKNGDEYTLSSYYLDSSLESCDTSLNWTLIEQNEIDVNGNFNVSGSGVGNICFYRDGTSTGGNFAFDPKDSEDTELDSATISVTLATGYIDVIR